MDGRRVVAYDECPLRCIRASGDVPERAAFVIELCLRSCDGRHAFLIRALSLAFFIRLENVHGSNGEPVLAAKTYSSSPS